MNLFVVAFELSFVSGQRLLCITTNAIKLFLHTHMLTERCPSEAPKQQPLECFLLLLLLKTCQKCHTMAQLLNQARVAKVKVFSSEEAQEAGHHYFVTEEKWRRILFSGIPGIWSLLYSIYFLFSDWLLFRPSF